MDFEKTAGRALGGYFGKSAIATAGMGISMLLSYFFHILMTRMLSPSDYGDLSALAALLVIATLPTMSVQGLLSREVAKLEKAGKKPEGIVKKYLRETLEWGAAAALVLSVGAVMLLGGVSPLAIGAVFTLLSIPFAYGAAVITGYYQGRERLLELNALINAPVLLRVAAAGLLVFAGFGVAGAALSFPLGFALVLFPIILFYKWLSGKDEGKGLDIGSSYVRILGTNLLLVIFMYCDLFFVRLALGPEQTGYYNAMGVMAKIPFYISGAVVFVLLPQASKLTFADRKGLLKRLAVSSLFILPFALAFSLAPHQILSIFFGKTYADNGAAAFGILSTAMVLFGMANLLVNLLWSQGKEDFPLALSILIIPFQAALLYFLVPAGGLAGAAAATLVSSAVLLLGNAGAVLYYSAMMRKVVE